MPMVNGIEINEFEAGVVQKLQKKFTIQEKLPGKWYICSISGHIHHGPMSEDAARDRASNMMKERLYKYHRKLHDKLFPTITQEEKVQTPN